MLKHVKVTNYRGFERYELTDLTTVNLLVGKNNCGKTSLLESVQFLVSGGDPLVLAHIAARRGELVADASEGRSALDLSHFFFRQEVRLGRAFEVQGDGVPRIVVEVVSADEADLPQRTLFSADEPPLDFLLRISRGGAETPHRNLYLTDRGTLLNDPRRGARRFGSDERREGPPVVFIAPESLTSASLGAMWRQILRDKREISVREAMRILEPTIEDIVFEPGDATYRTGSDRAGVLVSFQDDARRIPLGTLGDGMRRLLSLAVSLVHIRGGVLIMDEIDTGFHYSIMPQMWQLVVKLAVEANIQVFATTHSWDCVEGLSQFCQQQPELAIHTAIQKIDRDIPHSIGFSGEAIARMIKADIDPR